MYVNEIDELIDRIFDNIFKEIILKKKINDIKN